MGSASSKLGYIIPNGKVCSLGSKKKLAAAKNKGYNIYPSSADAVKALRVMKTVGALLYDANEFEYVIYKWDDENVYGATDDDKEYIDTRKSIIFSTVEQARKYMSTPKKQRPVPGQGETQYLVAFGRTHPIKSIDDLDETDVTYPTLQQANQALSLMLARTGIIVYNNKLYRVFEIADNFIHSKVIGITLPPKYGVAIPYAKVRAFANANDLRAFVNTLNVASSHDQYFTPDAKKMQKGK